MKIFKRPMFRKGGEVGGGIMTGVMRENYQDGSARERLARIAAQYPSSAIDPLSQFLIQGGLNLVSGPATGGGVLADAATAFKEPTAGLFQGLAQKGQMEKELALQGEVLDIEREREMDLLKKKAELKVGKEFRTDQVTPAFENVIEGLTETYSKSDNPALASAANQSAFDITKFRREADPKLIARFKGIKNYAYNNQGEVVEVPREYNPGDIVYDPVSKEFVVYDNQGGTFFLNKLTFDIEG
jgi:hypothetical protein